MTASKGTKVTTPVPGFTGVGVGGLEFDDGVAYTDDPAILAYCETAGYGVGDNKPAATEPVQPAVDARDASEPVTVGGPTRDAAVDPREDDYLPPVNAGQADPHGPDVVAPGVHGSSFGPIVPGAVHEAKETSVAQRVFVDGEDVGDVTDAHADDNRGPIDLSDESSGGYADTGTADTEGAVSPTPAKKTAAKRTASRRS